MGVFSERCPRRGGVYEAWRAAACEVWGVTEKKHILGVGKKELGLVEMVCAGCVACGYLRETRSAEVDYGGGEYAAFNSDDFGLSVC